MHHIFFLILLFPGLFAAAQEPNHEVRTKKNASLTVSLNSNGISSIPAFSLGAPAIVGTAGLSLGRLSYDPVLAYGIDMKPWYIDSWIHYLVIDRTSFRLRTGFNFSNFFSELKLPDKTILQGERFWALELAGIYNINEKTSITLMYWNDRGQDPGTISGHFLALAGDMWDIKISKQARLGLNIMAFYIGYTGKNDGFFVSPKISLSAGKSPISIFLQANQPISSNIEPSPLFEWNAGTALSF
jgi:hypothetical protein